ncbi:two-component system, NtrC family, nitrogen regulation sensor histidine kinase NtrY [Desulfonatronum thiosulfatophilum]|uniref:histidine kinase n=1 Tax=Desulfonatronum thiosulfatophilum TaxID=617002 RepID=A0A1G6DXJ0_9BACT|nr:ATP-binding protein [Desulfonatronum thiosulfatophilum]SDB49848.1 two-component system, NtrC family, nitrogen regulation sensor histidine kinase NtrY [Desulfonatronum thiosulfatophilum]
MPEKPPPAEPIRVSVPDSNQRKRQQRELYLALFGFIAVVVLAWVQLNFLQVDSYVFFALYNLNFILLLVVLLLVARNVVKLVLERRRKVIGVRLRTRLVLAFVSLSLVPTVLLFVISLIFVRTSVDYWFQGQVEKSLEQALNVGQSFYSSAQDRLEQRGSFLLYQIRDRQMAWGGRNMNAFLDEKRLEYNLGLVGVLSTQLREQNWNADEDWAKVWPELRSEMNLESLLENPRILSAIHPGPEFDLVVGILPVDDGRTGYLVLGDSLGEGLLFKLRQIVRGVDEYKKLQTLKYPLKVTLYLVLGLITLLIILAAIWFGFRLAKELSAPVHALALGTQRISEGDLAFRLHDDAKDELGMLVQSFNHMVQDLEANRAKLTKANLRLEEQNQELETRGRYMEAVLDNITSGVVSIGADGRVTTVNKAAEAILNFDSRQILGKTPNQFLHQDYLVMLQGVAKHLQTHPQAKWQRQLDLRVDKREIKLLVNIVHLQDQGGIIAVFEDVTELEKMHRLAAWKDVARRIAHEIKNPLTPIKLSAQRLERKFSSQVDDRTVFSQCTRIITRQVEHLQRMVQEFSSFAKLPEVRLAEGELEPDLEEIVDMFRTSHVGIQWHLEIATPIPPLKFDPEALRRVWINLMTNAVEALDEQPHPEVVIQAAYLPENQTVVVKFADNGLGLNQVEDIQSIFEPYFSRKKGGTGLGLTIAKSIVGEHRGTILVRKNKPVGCVFEVVLPA